MQTAPIQAPQPQRMPSNAVAPDSDAASFAQALNDAQAPEPAPKAAEQKPRSPGARNEATPGRPPKQEAPDAEAADAPEEPAAARKAKDAKPGKDKAPDEADLGALLPGWTPPAMQTRGDAAARAGKAAHDALNAASAKPGRERANDKDSAADVSARAAQLGADNATAHADATQLVAQAESSVAAKLHADTPAAAAAPAGASPAATPTLSTTAPAANDTPSAPFQAQLAAAVNSPEFAPALGGQIRILAQDGVQEAQLHLNPAEMGPITVQIELVGAQARVEFTAEHAATRAAIENGLPELASALRESGLTLTGGGVFEQSRQREREGGSPKSGRGRGDAAGADAAVESAAPRGAARRGVVDLYA